MKKKYCPPDLWIVLLSDVITASGDPIPPDPDIVPPDV